MPIDLSLAGGAGDGAPQGGGSGELGSILGALAMAYGVYQGSRNQDKQNRFEREMADTKYQRDKEMSDLQWQRQNEYNSPSAQMARYQAAGLNPNLIYGSGASSAGNASSPSPVNYTPPNVSYAFNPAAQLMQAIPMYQNFQLQAAQIDNVRAQTENTRARTINESMRQWLLDLQGRTGEFELDRKGQMLPYQMQVLHQQTEKSAVGVKQEFERLALLKQAQQMNLLKSSAIQQAMSSTDLQMEKNRADLLFMKYRNDWMKMGVTSGDNALLRIFVRMLTRSGLDEQASQYMFGKP